MKSEKEVESEKNGTRLEELGITNSKPRRDIGASLSLLKRGW